MNEKIEKLVKLQEELTRDGYFEDAKIVQDGIDALVSLINAVKTAARLTDE